MRKYRNLSLAVEQTTEDLSVTQHVEYHDAITTSSPTSGNMAISHRKKEVDIPFTGDEIETIPGSVNPDKNSIIQLQNKKGNLHLQIAWFDKMAESYSETIVSLKKKIKRDEDMFMRERSELNSKLVCLEEIIVSLQNMMKEMTNEIERNEDMF